MARRSGSPFGAAPVGRRASAGAAYPVAPLLALAALGVAGPAAAQGQGAVPSGGSGAVIKPPEEQPPPPKPVVVPPKLKKFVEAPYPPEALAAGLTGSVILKLTIDATGKVTAAEVITGAGHGFDAAAQAAAMGFEFEPATRNGQPVASKIPYEYVFTLREATPEEAPPPPPPTTGELSGQVRLDQTDAGLAGARVVVRGPGGFTATADADADGRFRFTGLPPGAYTVAVEAEGFEATRYDEQVVAGEAAELVYRLAPVAGEYEVVVRGERPPREVTRRTLERREISRVPGTGGDALRSIQSLPGVARPPGLAGLLIVRGSAPQDTQTFIDGASVPLIYHFGGLSSAVPTELLDQIDFYPGNFSAAYGRGMGGIVDVKLRAPDTRCTGPYGKALAREETGCFHGLAQVDLIDARFLVEGPIAGDWTFIAGGRRSWIDAWLKPVLEEAGAGVTTAPVYYDYQLIAETTPSDDSRLSLRTFGSDDRLELIIYDPNAQEPGFAGNLTFGTSFLRVQALYEDQLTPTVEQRAMISVGKSTLGLSLGALAFDLRIYPIELRNEFGFKLGESVRLNTGLDFQLAPFEVFVRAPPPPRPGEPDPGPFSTRPPLETRVEQIAFRPAAYAEAEITPSRRARVIPGFRVDYARDNGRIDLSPRISGRYDLVTNTDGTQSEAEAHAAGTRRLRTTLKGGVGVFHQQPQFQETDPVFGTPHLPSNRAIHYSLGGEQELTRHIELSVEGFYKDLDQLVSRVPSASGGFGYDNAGEGYTMGVESLVKYKPDARFFGWLAYTLSRSVRQERPEDEERLFQYDQTHNLTVLGSYRLGRGWEFGARFRVISGSLDTPVLRPPSLSAIYAADAGTYVPIQGEVFSERLPLFHQVDIRVDKRWQFESWRLSAYLDVQNVYNNAAVESLLYDFDFSQKTYQTGLPIIPSLGVRGEF